jgi:hypothetical protein
VNLPAHFVFVDFENVPDIDLALIAGQSVKITLLIGKNQTRLDLALVRHIHRLADRVELIEVGASGHNALDLTLAYHLGHTACQAPRATFHIVSKDTDFDPLVSHLNASGIAVARHRSFDALPFLGTKKKVENPPAKPVQDRRAKVLARLKNPSSRNRPSSKSALVAHLKTALGKESSAAIVEEILGELIRSRVLTIDAATDKVSYA